MVSAEVILVSEGCKEPIEMTVIMLFFFVLYFMAMIFLVLRIKEVIKLKKKIVSLERRLNRTKTFK